MPDPGSVPPPIAESEPQAGAPRTIHPIGSPALRVGRPVIRRITTMDRPTEYHIVTTSEVRQSRSGKSAMQFAAGTKVPLHVAYEYGLIDAPQAVSARPEGEEPATAPNDDPVFERSEGAAPENRMEPALENRGYESVKAAEEAAANAAEDEAASKSASRKTKSAE